MAEATTIGLSPLVNNSKEAFLRDLEWETRKEYLSKQSSNVGMSHDVSFWYTCGIVLISLALMTALVSCLALAVYMVRITAMEYDANRKWWGKKDFDQLDIWEDIPGAAPKGSLKRSTPGTEPLSTGHVRDFTDTKVEWSSQRRIEEAAKEDYRPSNYRQFSRQIPLSSPKRSNSAVRTIIKSDRKTTDPAYTEKDPETGHVYVPFPSADYVVVPNDAPPYTKSPSFNQHIIYGEENKTPTQGSHVHVDMGTHANRAPRSVGNQPKSILKSPKAIGPREKRRDPRSPKKGVKQGKKRKQKEPGKGGHQRGRIGKNKAEKRSVSVTSGSLSSTRRSVSVTPPLKRSGGGRKGVSVGSRSSRTLSRTSSAITPMSESNTLNLSQSENVDGSVRPSEERSVTHEGEAEEERLGTARSDTAIERASGSTQAEAIVKDIEDVSSGESYQVDEFANEDLGDEAEVEDTGEDFHDQEEEFAQSEGTETERDFQEEAYEEESDELIEEEKVYEEEDAEDEEVPQDEFGSGAEDDEREYGE